MSVDQGSSRELSPSASGPKSGLLPSEVLAKAADLIEPAGAWLQSSFAETARGLPIDSVHALAARFCLAGALNHLGARALTPCGAAARRAVCEVTGAKTAMGWNDAPGRTQAQVVAVLRKASELAKAEGQ